MSFVVSTIYDGAENFFEVFSKERWEGKLRLIPVIGGVVAVYSAALKPMACLGMVLSGAAVVKMRAVFDPNCRELGDRWLACAKSFTPLVSLEIG